MDPSNSDSQVERFSLEWWKFVGLCFLAMVLASSAFVVYERTCKELSPAVTYFWFVFFASMMMFVIPREHTNWFQVRQNTSSWIGSLRKGAYLKIIISSVLYTVEFALLLYALAYDVNGVVVTVLVIQLLVAPFNTILAHFALGDVYYWRWWLLGAFVTISGVMLYQLSEIDMELGWTSAANVVSLLTLLNVICRVIEDNLRACYRRQNEIHPSDANTTLLLLNFLFSILLVWITEGGTLAALLSPSFEQMLALLYLGIVPTAVGITWTNESQDALGFADADAIGSLKPMAAYALGLIPFAWFYVPDQGLSTVQYVGALIALSGVVITVRKARSTPGHSNNKGWCKKPEVMPSRDSENTTPDD